MWLRCTIHNIKYLFGEQCDECKITQIQEKLAKLQVKPEHGMFDFDIDAIKKSHEIKSNKADHQSPHGTLPKSFGNRELVDWPSKTSGTLPKGFYKISKDKIPKPKKPSLFKQILLALKIAEKKNA